MSQTGFTLRGHGTRADMDAAATHDIGAYLSSKLAEQDHVTAVFAAAPSQAGTLAGLRGRTDIEWSRVTAFHMDEYVGLPSGHPAGFGTWLNRHLFDYLPFKAVHLIDTAGDPSLAADRYAEMLGAERIDMVCLGIGVNGHIAFNDPPVADFFDPKRVKLVELDEICRQQQVDDGGFPTLAEVPRQAVTLTVPQLMNAERLFCIVPGASKRDAVTRALTGPIETACPASILRRHADCTLYVDAESYRQ